MASQVSRITSDTNENLLRVNLSKFFTDLEHEIQSALLEYWNDQSMLMGQLNLILAPIHEKHQEYYELIMKHKLQEFHRAEAQGKRLVQRANQSAALKAAKPVKFTHNRNNLFGTLKYSEDKLRNNTFTASENTLNRVDSNINQILTDGYRSGQGIDKVSQQITERFDQLRTWEAKRIARTEIHTAQNMGIMNSYDQLGVEYTQWIAADDDRTRDSHAEINGEIIPIGSTYSNGLAYPGDTSGPIEEWINCRCSNAPFVLPAGMMAPSFSPFREEDLVPIDNQQNPLEQLQQPTPQKETPTEEPQPIATETNPIIASLEKELQEVQQLEEKWRKRGNTNMAKNFAKDVERIQGQIDQLKNPDTNTPKSTQEISAHDNDVINNILADALADVGLGDIAPARKPISPDVEIRKNIETTHKSNLWENLAEKHGFELVEASKTKVTFYDHKYKTPIQFNIPKNNKWIDYTNSGRKKVNMEEVLKCYNSAETIQKKATPIIHIEGKSLDHGTVTISKNVFKLELFEGAFYKTKGSINGGNLKGAMHHEMWHCVDIRMTDETAVRNNSVLKSNMKGGAYKKSVTADRRIKKKTGGQQFCSDYARQSGGRNNVFEDFAEAGSVMSSNTYLIIKEKGKYVKLTKKEFMKKYPNRADHIQDIIDNGELLW